MFDLAPVLVLVPRSEPESPSCKTYLHHGALLTSSMYSAGRSTPGGIIDDVVWRADCESQIDLKHF